MSLILLVLEQGQNMLAFAPVWNSLSYLCLTGHCVLFPRLFAVGWCRPAEINTLHSPYKYYGDASQSVVIKDVLNLTLIPRI